MSGHDTIKIKLLAQNLKQLLLRLLVQLTNGFMSYEIAAIPAGV